MKITNKDIPMRVHNFFLEKIGCAETAEPRMTVFYTTHSGYLDSVFSAAFFSCPSSGPF